MQLEEALVRQLQPQLRLLPQLMAQRQLRQHLPQQLLQRLQQQPIYSDSHCYCDSNASVYSNGYGSRLHEFQRGLQPAGGKAGGC